jgi:hypothetical protein
MKRPNSTTEKLRLIAEQGWTVTKPYEEYSQRIRLAKEVLDWVYAAEGEELWTASRSNFVINLVTAIEVYLKQLIIERKDVWHTEGYAHLLSEKITLNDAINLFKGSDITKEVIVSHFYSFQSLESISATFDELVQNKFLKIVGETHVFDDDLNLDMMDNLYPQWKKTLADVFETRHQIVHEGKCNLILTQANIDQFTTCMNEFAFAVDSSCKRSFNP